MATWTGYIQKGPGPPVVGGVVALVGADGVEEWTVKLADGSAPDGITRTEILARITQPAVELGDLAGDTASRAQALRSRWIGSPAATLKVTGLVKQDGSIEWRFGRIDDSPKTVPHGPTLFNRSRALLVAALLEELRDVAG